MNNEIDNIGNIKDMGDSTIKCSDCNKPLMHYRVFAPEANIAHKIQANCPFCNGNSFTVAIKGLFRYGPISQEESVDATVVQDFDYNVDGVSKFTILQRKK